ncbi:MAG TPA: 2-phospho-L-lactate guanylyltransferase [Ktedonobacteraceae bacterium]|nr:2-phospho-L-lactate guanylyltransferase [Ktedonobacteraceae bacterium]
MGYYALVPIKTLTEAKSRLASHLSPTQRETLVLDMLRYVLCILHASEELEQVVVVSPDERVLERAQSWGAEAWPEEAHGHNAALGAAATRIRVMGAAGLLTISADLPLLRVQDIRALVSRAARHPVVIAPSREGTGTNALFVRPPLTIPYLFGANSFQHHVQAAGKRQLSVSIYYSTGLAWDIDTIDDIRELHESQAGVQHELTAYYS